MSVAAAKTVVAAPSVKPDVMALAKKHHFWILSGLLVLIALPCWYLGTDAIRIKTEEQKSMLDGKFVELDGERNKTEGGLPYHPNDGFKKGILDLGSAQFNDVWQAWNDLYQHQVSTVLKWPAGIPEVVRERLRNGNFFLLPPQDPESVQIRSIYRDYVLRDEPKRLENRLGLLKARAVTPPKTATPIPMPGAAPGSGAEEAPKVVVEYDGVVLWPQFMSIFDQYNWTVAIPTPKQVLCCQEDIWVYTGLFDVIAETNKDITDYKKAWVKQVISLEIGKHVPPAPSSIQSALGMGAAGAGGIPGYGGTEGAMLPSGGGPGAPGFEGGAGGGSQDDVLVDRRYVRSNGAPILESELKAGDPDPEFNLIPFRLCLHMDQRRLMNLLSVCANNPLPIRVRSVQVLKWNELGAGAAGGGAPSSFGSRTALPMPTPEELRGPYDVAVELRGMIYIYQRPDVKHLPELLRAHQAAVAAAAGPAGGTTLPGGALPPNGTVPGGAAPGSAAPGGAVPAVPGGAVPAAPGGATPDGAAPAVPGGAAPVTPPGGAPVPPTDAATPAAPAPVANPGAAPAAP